MSARNSRSLSVFASTLSHAGVDLFTDGFEAVFFDPFFEEPELLVERLEELQELSLLERGGGDVFAFSELGHGLFDLSVFAFVDLINFSRDPLVLREELAVDCKPVGRDSFGESTFTDFVDEVRPELPGIVREGDFLRRIVTVESHDRRTGGGTPVRTTGARREGKALSGKGKGEGRIQGPGVRIQKGIFEMKWASSFRMRS